MSYVLYKYRTEDTFKQIKQDEEASPIGMNVKYWWIYELPSWVSQCLFVVVLAGDKYDKQGVQWTYCKHLEPPWEWMEVDSC